MLTNYQTRTQQLLQYPSSSATQLYATADITTWVNIARGQLAGEAGCILKQGTISTVVGQRPYNFSSISTGVSATTGIAGVINVQQALVSIASGYQWLKPRAWPWFTLYNLNNVVPQNGPPVTWSQYGQGAAPGSTGAGAGGSFYLDPPPDIIYSLLLDCVCFPIDLVNDATVEAIPYLWTDAVPYYAAYLALLAAESGARTAEAMRYFEMYQMFVDRARNASNPDVVNYLYKKAPDPTVLAKLGQQRIAQGGG